MWSYLSEQKILYVCIAVCLCAISYLSLSQKQREIIVKRLYLRRRRRSSVGTPPRSVSPEKKVPSNATPKADEYVTTFPPSQREILQGLKQSLPPKQRKALGDLTFDQDKFERSLLGWEEDYRSADASKYVYSGFSIQEVKALGDFPDYATLSEVPLPQAYDAFDVDKALPRPYRPFRWAYHQTMSLTKLETDWWLELENTYRDRIAQRKTLYAENGGDVLQWLPGSELACKELMEMALQFLCARYPQYFRLVPSKDEPGKTVFENKILNTTEIVQNRHPLLVLLDHVPEDFAVVSLLSSLGLCFAND